MRFVSVHRRHPAGLFLRLLLGLVFATSSLSAAAESAGALHHDGGSREAYVSLLYGNFYALPLRTMMRSLVENSLDAKSGRRERVVIVTGSTSARTVEQLRSDGIKVKRIPTVRTPYAADAGFDSRFEGVLTKLAIFNMTEYSRIVFVDADALVTRDMSDTFACGRFCAVFINPCHFNSGLMLVTPSTALFDDMLRALPTLPSYDGGDQGFLNSFYPQMLTAPMYAPDASGRDTSQLDFVRLPSAYHMDHGAFYPRLRWDHAASRCGGAMREEEWLGPAFAKPWLWYTYFGLDQSWVWYKYRSLVTQPYPEGSQTDKSAALIIGVSYLVFCPLLGAGHYMQYTIGTLLPRRASPFTNVGRRHSLIVVFAFGWLLWAVSVFAAGAVVPPLLPPVLAFVTFAHARAACMFTFLLFPFGSVACCGQRSARGLARAVRRTESALTSAPSLRRIVSECARWAVVDCLFVHACNYLMWKVPMHAMASKVLFVLAFLCLQFLLTSTMLLRLGFVWLAWANTLPPIATT